MCYTHQLLDQNCKETAEMESVTTFYHSMSTGRQWGVNTHLTGDRSYILALLLSYVTLIVSQPF